MYSTAWSVRCKILKCNFCARVHVFFGIWKLVCICICFTFFSSWKFTHRLLLLFFWNVHSQWTVSIIVRSKKWIKCIWFFFCLLDRSSLIHIRYVDIFQNRNDFHLKTKQQWYMLECVCKHYFAPYSWNERFNNSK